MKPDGGDNPEEQLSAAFDEEVRAIPNVSEERRVQLESNWSALRSLLQEADVEAIDLEQEILSKVASEQFKSVGPQKQDPQLMWIRRIAVLASVAAIVAVAVIPLIQTDNIPETASLSRLPIADIGNVQAARQHLSQLASRLPDSSVLVVNVASGSSVEDTVSAILGTARDRGADVTPMHSVVDEDAEYSAGFLLTAGSKSELIQDSLADNPDLLEWNPDRIGGRSPQEIKEMFLAAMEVPTESDKVFGSMYVVDEEGLQVALQELPSDVETSSASGVLMADVAEANSDEPTPSAAKVAPAVERQSRVAAPVIVIFRQQQPAPAAAPNQDQGYLPPARATEPHA